MDANEMFNQELLRQIQGTLPKGHIYRLGRPCDILYLDKSKIQILIDQQRISLAEVEYLDLDLIEILIRDFKNPI